MPPTRAELPLAEMKAMLDDLRRQEQPIRRGASALAAESLNSEAQNDAPVRTGVLKEAHIVDLSNPDEPRLGANTTYAAAVHALHPGKARWYLNAIVANGARVMRKSIELVAAKVGRNAGGGGA